MRMNELRIDKKIFQESSLKKAINAYSKISVIECQEKPDYWLLEFKYCVYEVEKTINEFENFLICIEATNGDCHGSM